MRAADAGLAKALEFALPALFLGLVWASTSRAMLWPMMIAGGLSGGLILAGLPELAIPAGALAAFTVWRRA